jgi:hypothetical protein
VPPRSRAGKILTIVGALVVAGVAVWYGSQALVISGTKSTFSFVAVKAVPGGGPVTRSTTSTTATKSTTTATQSSIGATTGSR